MKTKKEKEQSERRNRFVRYLELVLIFALTIVFMLGLRIFYLNDQNYQKTIPIMRDVLFEIRAGEVENFVNEKQDAILYVGTASNEQSRAFEKDFKPYVEENHLEDVITYLNLSDVNVDDFYNQFNSQYNYSSSWSYPAFVVFEDGKVKSLLASTKSKTFDINEVDFFLRDNGLGVYLK